MGELLTQRIGELDVAQTTIDAAVPSEVQAPAPDTIRHLSLVRPLESLEVVSGAGVADGTEQWQAIATARNSVDNIYDMTGPAIPNRSSQQKAA